MRRVAKGRAANESSSKAQDKHQWTEHELVILNNRKDDQVNEWYVPPISTQVKMDRNDELNEKSSGFFQFIPADIASLCTAAAWLAQLCKVGRASHGY